MRSRCTSTASARIVAGVAAPRRHRARRLRRAAAHGGPGMSDHPPTREELAVSLAVNAASKPFNIAVAVVAFVVVLLIGAPAFVALLVAVVLYTAAVARTMFDGDEAERVTRKHHGGAGEPASRTRRRRPRARPGPGPGAPAAAAGYPAAALAVALLAPGGLDRRREARHLDLELLPVARGGPGTWGRAAVRGSGSWTEATPVARLAVQIGDRTPDGRPGRRATARAARPRARGSRRAAPAPRGVGCPRRALP